MLYVKPPIGIEEADVLLETVFQNKICNLRINNEGQIAQTFSFEIDGKNYFIQFNDLNMSQGGMTELFFQGRFKQYDIPSRKIMGSNRYKDYCYLITENAKGSPFHQLDEKGQMQCLPSVLDLMVNISKVKIDDTHGYGWLNSDCNGIFPSWTAHILQVKDEEPGYFYGNWHELFEKTFLEKQVFEQYYSRMKELLSTIKETRHLVHGGLGYGNLLISGNRVSAILDWQDTKYGDPLYDIAYLLFWRPIELQRRIIGYFNEYIKDKDYDTINMPNRLYCYKYYIGLDSMRFFAKTNNLNGYNATKSVMKEIETIL